MDPLAAIVADMNEVQPRVRVPQVMSVRSLFGHILPLLRSERDAVLDAVMFALGFTNWMAYKVRGHAVWAPPKPSPSRRARRTAGGGA